MEGPGMGETIKPESQMASASAFVQGGIQEPCDDACSICLDPFCDDDPSTMTCCKHEFHLHCILEWCQRSSNCPLCWQSIRLKDPNSQELLEAVEQERSFRSRPARNSRIYHHSSFGDFELQHRPVNANDTRLEDRILQHLAAAAAMGRAQHFSRRDGSRTPSSAHARRQFSVFSTDPSSPSREPVSTLVAPTEGEPEPESLSVPTHSVPLTAGGSELAQQNQFSNVQSGHISASPSTVVPVSRQRFLVDNRNFASQSSLPNPDRAGPSDFQSLSDSWKSRLGSMSMKYKDSISRSTRVWKEKLFSRSTSMADIGSEVRREVTAGIANVSRMMERLDSRENYMGWGSITGDLSESSNREQTSHNNVETRQRTPFTSNGTASDADAVSP